MHLPFYPQEVPMGAWNSRDNKRAWALKAICMYMYNEYTYIHVYMYVYIRSSKLGGGPLCGDGCLLGILHTCNGQSRGLSNT